MKIKINQILRVLVCCIFIIPCSCSGTENSGNQNVPPDPVEKIPQKVILDTDMCLDVDDVGALATLNALQIRTKRKFWLYASTRYTKAEQLQ